MLPLIAKEGALLSSKRLNYTRPTTSNRRGGSERSGAGRCAVGLEDIYASTSPTSLSYAFAPDGQYPVISARYIHYQETDERLAAEGRARPITNH